MNDEPREHFSCDLEEIEQYLRRVPADIKKGKALTANRLAIILICGVVFSLPLYLLILFARPEIVDKVEVIFDKWYTIISPLAGAAVGAYYGSSWATMHRKNVR